MDDLISRQEAVKAVENLNITSFYEENEHSHETYKEIKEALKTLPSVQLSFENDSKIKRYSKDSIDRHAAIEICRKAKDKSQAHRMLMQLPSVQPEQHWIYVEQELPKTVINEVSHQYQAYNCLCDFGDGGMDVRTYQFGYGHFRNGSGDVDKYVIAWMPLPEIPDELKGE